MSNAGPSQRCAWRPLWNAAVILRTSPSQANIFPYLSSSEKQEARVPLSLSHQEDQSSKEVLGLDLQRTGDEISGHCLGRGRGSTGAEPRSPGDSGRAERGRQHRVTLSLVQHFLRLTLGSAPLEAMSPLREGCWPRNFLPSQLPLISVSTKGSWSCELI